MWIGDILQDILVELLNGNWLSIISFTNYNCFSLFMAVLRDRHSSFLAVGELPARRPLSPPHQPMLLKGTGRNPLGMFPHCPAPWSLSPPPPASPTSAQCPLGWGPFAWSPCQRAVCSLWQIPGPGRQLGLPGNSELWNVMGVNSWYLMFPFLVWSQGLGCDFSSFPLWDLCKTLFLFAPQATPSHQCEVLLSV